MLTHKKLKKKSVSFQEYELKINVTLLTNSVVTNIVQYILMIYRKHLIKQTFNLI